MRCVILESPYRGATFGGRLKNLAYARACLRDSLNRGEAPIASHLLFTQPGVLDDDVPAERAHGIAAGLAWLEHAAAMVVYEDRGISGGMAAAMIEAEKAGVPIERRVLREIPRGISEVRG